MGVTSQALHGAKVCIIPRPENNYRPLMLRRRSLAVASGLLVSIKVLAVSLVLLLPATAELSTITSARILQLTNEERVADGLGALKENASLSKAAASKARDIIDNDYFAHISPSGVTPWFWMQQQGYSYSVAGENLAIDFVQAEDVVDAWMASPGHRENILQKDYIETGIAVLTGEFQGGTSTIVVHMFGLPSGAVRPSESSLSARPPIVNTVPDKVIPEIPVVEEAIVEIPSVPEVKLLGDKQTYRDSVALIISADVGSTVKISVDNVDVATLVVKEGGYLMHTLSLATFDDGKLNITAYALNENGVRSAKASPIVIGKDTVGPSIGEESLSFIASPSTDAPNVLMFLPESDYARLTVEEDGSTVVSVASPVPDFISFDVSGESIKVIAFDELGNSGVFDEVDLRPAIFSDRNISSTTKNTHEINKAARRLLMVVGTILIILLLLAILIKMKVQHPQMVAHTSLVILLAVALLFI